MSIQVFGGGGVQVRTKESINSIVRSWFDLVEILQPRYAHGSFVYNNKIYIVGGISSGRVIRSVEYYDLNTGGQGFSEPLPEPRAYFGYVFIENKFYVIGGVDNNYLPTDTIYVYDVLNNQWNLVANLPSKLAYLSACLLPDNRVLITGGTDSNGNTVSSVYVYNPIDNSISQVSSMNYARENHTCIYYNGYVYVFGGDNGNTALDSIEKYDVASDNWEIVGSLPRPVTGLRSIIYNNYVLLVSG